MNFYIFAVAIFLLLMINHAEVSKFPSNLDRLSDLARYKHIPIVRNDWNQFLTNLTDSLKRKRRIEVSRNALSALNAVINKRRKRFVALLPRIVLVAQVLNITQTAIEITPWKSLKMNYFYKLVFLLFVLWLYFVWN